MGPPTFPRSAVLAISVCIVFLLFFLAVTYVRFSPSEGDAPTDISTAEELISPTPAVVREGSLMLSSASHVSIYDVGAPVTLNVVADSAGRSIVTYDVVVAFDDAVLEFQSAESLHPDFDVFETVSDGSLAITGVKKLESTADVYFASETLARLTFVARSEGSARIAIASTPGAVDDSNLIDTETQDILDKTEAPDIFVGQKVVLEKGVPRTFFDDALTLTLTAVDPIPVGCADCTESATVVVKTSQGEETLEFISGGIGGLIELTAATDDYQIEVDNIDTETITVRVATL